MLIGLSFAFWDHSRSYLDLPNVGGEEPSAPVSPRRQLERLLGGRQSELLPLERGEPRVVGPLERRRRRLLHHLRRVRCRHPHVVRTSVSKEAASWRALLANQQRAGMNGLRPLLRALGRRRRRLLGLSPREDTGRQPWATSRNGFRCSEQTEATFVQPGLERARAGGQSRD